MKAKKHPDHLTRHRRHEEPLPHELGTHLFALIKRNLLNRTRPVPATASQLTFAF